MDRTASLDIAFNPRSVAVAGVGPETTGRLYVESLRRTGFAGEVYPLHPKGGEIDGLKVYAGLAQVPGPVDLVISCVPAHLVPQLLRDCSEKGVKVLSMFTSGFSELGTEEGRRLEAEIVRLARAGGVRLIGPNCMGIYCPAGGLSFVFDFPRDRGSVALVCQSGGHTIYFVRAAARRGIRFSKVVSYGNACDVDETDLLEYLTDDADTDIVTAYIEGVKDGDRFFRVLKRLSVRKPVAVLKGGTTETGARTAASHTGSMVGSREVWEGLLRQAGAIQVDTLEELIDIAVTFRFMRLPRGRRMAMVAGGGGASVLATDTSVASGFTMPAVPGAVAEEIRRSLPTEAGAVVSNPVELNMSPESSYTIASSLLKADAYDMLLGHCVFGQPPWPVFNPWYDLVCDTVTSVHRDVDKPVAIILESDVPGESEWYLGLEGRYWEAGIPVYHSVAGACRAIDRFMRHREARGPAAGH